MKKLILLALMLNSSFALAEGTRYHCECLDNINGDRTLKIYRYNVEIFNLDPRFGRVGYSYLADYRSVPGSRKGPVKKAHYFGIEYGNKREVIIETNVLLDAKVGYMQIRGEDGGRWSSKYECTRIGRK